MNEQSHNHTHEDEPAYCVLCEKHHYGSTTCPMKAKTQRVRIAVAVYANGFVCTDGHAHMKDVLHMIDKWGLPIAQGIAEADIPLSEPAETIKGEVKE